MTTSPSGLAALANGAVLSPFTQLRKLLGDTPAGHANVIDLTIGEPREPMPPFVTEKLLEVQTAYANYPPIRGTGELRTAISNWAAKRFGANAAPDPEREILPINGSREGLFLAALPAVGRKANVSRPAVLMCNPYYSAYVGGALATNAEPVYLNATAATGHLPDLEALAQNKALLERAAALYLCSPANPQGAVANAQYIKRALDLARAYDFILFFDECYSEIYDTTPPTGALEVAAQTPERFSNLVVFNSLSKRSNLPGLRSGFCAGDASFIDTFGEIRNMVAPQMPGPTQHASAAVWSDEVHVEANRAAYRQKYDVCDRVLQGRYGYQRPAGGFFLWLDVNNFGGASEATVTLWQRAGVKVLPGAFLAQAGCDGTNPGADYLRLALVRDPATVGEALERLVVVLA
ncbi:aminotransferase class I/II-fold pyridoxal phosphate-dependent enzyme [Hyphomicrobium sulfonivorans]|uniref:aminotransferase class I/II-fold pyridoxal phosphate-dependent enzyme n=1 Tax=Hyphomicrobium sulfonivorans TaxID=121290 RepID=UPI00156F9542|nr:aminotransferase class I/II-fold pyridoxal phosphate-dependent enzyme [Hyphomicrobium sulfonivorans]MBI1648560.1 aminotransferase class I/II-fold pyridoxal phosphate-dependent enzyme [Hyphomicrobium sulfonivorans]NSL70902.1 aspartate aminotransferase [Hyphomicrobium sulfonivorans]